MEQIRTIYNSVIDFLQLPVFPLGKTEVTLASLLFLIISLILLFYLSAKFRNLLQNRILVRYNLDIGIRQAISTIVRYIIIVVGLAIIIQSAGIDLSFLAIMAGALGVGIGFGLQNITNNFVSGLVILFERPVKVGDRIELTTSGGDVINGDVTNISARASTILTNDNIAIIVPNSNLISSTVINWSYNDRKVRFRIPIGVHYKEDPEKIRRLLVEVALENDGVLKTPPPDVQFSDFGDSSLDFLLRVWTTKYTHRPGFLKSQLYYAIHKKFKENDIEIPYPQRDLHLRSGFEPVNPK